MTPVGIGKGVLDHAAALGRLDGDAESLKEIALLFLEDYPRAMKEMGEAVLQGDAHHLEQAAHNLKGSVANFGARRVVEAAFQLEIMGRTHKLAEAERVFHTLELALTTLRTELEAL